MIAKHVQKNIIFLQCQSLNTIHLFNFRYFLLPSLLYGTPLFDTSLYLLNSCSRSVPCAAAEHTKYKPVSYELLTMYVCMLKVTLAVLPMERGTDWAKGRGPYVDLFSQPSSQNQHKRLTSSGQILLCT